MHQTVLLILSEAGKRGEAGGKKNAKLQLRQAQKIAIEKKLRGKSKKAFLKNNLFIYLLCWQED